MPLPEGRAPRVPEFSTEIWDSYHSSLRKEGQRFNASRSNRGFTMIEIALSLGILAFALIAIIGVLPLGLNVQKENREDSIINQDALYLMEAIRSGSKGLDELTNYVESITVTNVLIRSASSSAFATTNFAFAMGSYVGSDVIRIVKWSPAAGAQYRLTNGQQIIGLLSTPQFEIQTTGFAIVNGVTNVSTTVSVNFVEARMRAITGNALEAKRFGSDLAFRYLLRSEVIPFYNGRNDLQSEILRSNLFEIRLSLRWPLFERPDDSWGVGRSKRVLRTTVAGRMESVRLGNTPFSVNWLHPSSYTPYAINGVNP